MSNTAQLALPLETAPRFGREDFLVGAANAQAFAYIERWPRWLSPAAVLVGPEGSGKSHLAAIFASAAEARMLRAEHLTREDVPVLAHARAVVLEDADQGALDEVALFHLLNLARETGFFIVLTARMPPDHWGIRTPDLISRLRAQPLLELREPDEGLLGALFVKLFADRQIAVEASVVSYAMARVERSYAGITRLVAELDNRSLARKRPINRALVAECLGEAEARQADFEAEGGA